MELRQLKYFVKTAETLNFSEAARGLFVTQSTLSQQIRQLEQELGVELFQRDSHTVRLTENGEHLLPSAKRTLQDAESCFTQISDLKQMLSGTLNIGITHTFAPILNEAVRTFIKHYPGVSINVMVSNMEDVLSALKRGNLDFVLCFKPASLDDEIEAHILFDSQLSIIVGQDHPLAQKKSVTFEDIRLYRFAMPQRVTQARLLFNYCFPEAKDVLDVRAEIGDIAVLLDIVRSSQLVTVLSESTLYNRTGLKAIPIDANIPQMEGCVHTLKRSYRKRAAEEFIRILSQTNAVMERAHKWIR